MVRGWGAAALRLLHRQRNGGRAVRFGRRALAGAAGPHVRDGRPRRDASVGECRERHPHPGPHVLERPATAAAQRPSGPPSDRAAHGDGAAPPAAGRRGVRRPTRGWDASLRRARSGDSGDHRGIRRAIAAGRADSGGERRCARLRRDRDRAPPRAGPASSPSRMGSSSSCSHSCAPARGRCPSRRCAQGSCAFAPGLLAAYRQEARRRFRSRPPLTPPLEKATFLAGSSGSRSPPRMPYSGTA